MATPYMDRSLALFHIWNTFGRPAASSKPRTRTAVTPPMTASTPGQVTERRAHNYIVLRVYLDQNKWVDLARSRKTGFTDGLADFWDIAHAGVERDLLSFPLSAVHYFETTKRVRQDSRWDLAAAMAELSRMHTIAGANTLIPQEVDAVAARIYRDQIDPNAPDPSPIEPFGVGAAHALGAPPGTFAGQFSFEELRAAGMPEDMLTHVRRGLVDATELAVLARTESLGTGTQDRGANARADGRG